MKKKKFKRLNILIKILKTTKADKIITGFIGFTFIMAFVIMMVEPGITNYGDALWLCYAALTTIGFGDITAVTFIGRICCVLVSVYALFTLAIATGVVVTYYNEKIKIQHQDTINAFVEKLERLPELSKQELEELSNNVKNFRNR